MKRIGILSDTHGVWDRRFTEYFKECDEVWHAGDVGDPEIIQKLQALVPTVHAVYGNIDGQDVRWITESTAVFQCEDCKVMMQHITGYPGRWAPGMKLLINEIKPDIVVGGHSHILKVVYDKELQLLHLNPGAAGRQGWQSCRTLLRLTIDGSDIRNCEVIELH